LKRFSEQRSSSIERRSAVEDALMLPLSVRGIGKQNSLTRLVSDCVGEPGDMAERHGSLGNRVLVVVWFGQICRVIVSVVGY